MNDEILSISTKISTILDHRCNTTDEILKYNQTIQLNHFLWMGIRCTFLILVFSHSRSVVRYLMILLSAKMRKV